jgi:hypothetical protein
VSILNLSTSQLGNKNKFPALQGFFTYCPMIFNGLKHIGAPNSLCAPKNRQIKMKSMVSSWAPVAPPIPLMAFRCRTPEVPHAPLVRGRSETPNLPDINRWTKKMVAVCSSLHTQTLAEFHVRIPCRPLPKSVIMVAS